MTVPADAPPAPFPPARPRGTAIWPIVWAIALAALFTTSWALSDWRALRLLRLPDNDDMMRLAQVRDWLNGQTFNDLTQYRLGPPGGASMHWSRIADAGPAALILLLRPLVGQMQAELAMALIYTGLLFALYIWLIGRLAARLAGPQARITATILAALAFPTISLFIPGRIDHHGLQIVLVVVILGAVLAPPTFARGIVAGIALAASLAVGLEAAPEFVALLAVMGGQWVFAGRADDRRLTGFGLALGGATLAMLAFARPWVWPAEWCDGFTPSSTRATLVLAGGFTLLGLAGSALRSVPARVAASGAIGAGVAGLAAWLSPVCLGGPYSALHPFLKYAWMNNVSEARDIYFGQDTLGTSLAFGGLYIAGAVVGMALLRVPTIRARRDWQGLVVFLVLSTVAAILQIRVVYVMAGMAVIPFVAAIGRTRARPGGLAPRLALWVIGAGISWNMLAKPLDAAFAKPVERARIAARACTQGEPILVPGRMPRGTVMAPLDLGSYLMGMTPHHVVAAAYHRNNIGNLAMYRFFLSPPEEAATLSRRWRIDYVALCPESMQELEILRLRRGSLIERLQGPLAPPAWLRPIPTGGTLRFYRVVPPTPLS